MHAPSKSSAWSAAADADADADAEEPNLPEDNAPCLARPSRSTPASWTSVSAAAAAAALARNSGLCTRRSSAFGSSVAAIAIAESGPPLNRALLIARKRPPLLAVRGSTFRKREIAS
mmetsp:Transcript_1061/g.3926  ORF Transcript_1061/g.3926 Transcript_1061/m.3926 type:complete len:117 (-) Transcript_1061:752-1102(-)